MSLLTMLWPVAAGYAIAVTTWLFYLAAQSLLPKRERLHPIAKAHAYALVAVGVGLDVLLNAFVASALFLKLPRDWLFTTRLERYINDENEAAWRRRLAGWLCTHLLDLFDPDGCHCNKEPS